MIRTESPISNHFGLVFNDILLPVLAPIIDPTRTDKAGSQIIFPRYQYMLIAKVAVKIVTNREVAIALCMSSFMALRNGGNREPPLKIHQRREIILQARPATRRP